MTAAEISDSARPNLFVVGAAKAGTTSLWAYLDAHPDVFMSRVKEPHFFSCGGAPGQELVKEPAAYARLFAAGGAHRFRGEASPSYLWDPESAGQIKQSSPDAHIIVSLRDPVERAYAQYWTWVRIGVERRPFAEAVRAELGADHIDVGAKPPPYVSRGFYADSVRRYRETFGDSMILLLFEELVADVRGTMRFVFSRLGLDPGPADDLVPELHFPFQIPRNVAVDWTIRVPGVLPLAKAVFRGALRKRVETTLYRFEKPPLDPELRRLLRDIYAPHDEHLRRLLGRSLPWDGRA